MSRIYGTGLPSTLSARNMVRVRFSVRIMVRVRVRVRVIDLGSFLVLSGRKGRGQS